MKGDEMRPDSLFPRLAVRYAALMLVSAMTLHAQSGQRLAGVSAARRGCAPAPAPVAGDLRLSASKPDSAIPSRNWQTSTSVTFINGSCDAVSIVWVNYYGGRKLYRQLLPGATYTQQTFDDKTWVIESVNDAGPLGFFRSVVAPSRAVIRGRRTGDSR